MHSTIFSFVVLCVQLQLSTQTEVRLLQYFLSTSDDIIYNGGILSSDCDTLADGDRLRNCPIPSRLVDNITEEGQQFDRNRFIGWRGDFELIFQFPDTHITRVDIYFYNNPRMGYGLPPIKEAQYTFNSLVFDANGIPLQVSFVNNSHLSRSDDSVTVVSIVVSSDLLDSPYSYLRLSFDTSSTLINETFISEVKLINETERLPSFTDIQFSSPHQSIEYGLANDIVSSVELSCTVAIEGSFCIRWTGPNGAIIDSDNKTRIFSADTTRTSILMISQVSLMDNGTYSCEATYSHNANSATDTVTLILRGSVSHPNTVQAQEGDDSATLQCNFTGYFPSTINVIWRDGNGVEMEDFTDGYNITTSLSGPGLSQRGGDSVENGVTSTLTIISIELADLGTQYTCIMDGTNIQGTIQLIAPSSTPATESESNSIPTIAGAVAGGIVVFILIPVAILVVILLVVWYSKKQAVTVEDDDFNIYAECGPPSIPSFHESTGSVYNEDDLDPSVFKNAPPSENEDIYQIYRSVYSNPQPLQRNETLLEVKEKNLRKLKDLGVGQFGEVELAHTVGLSLKQLRMSESNNDPGVSLVVAVKRLKSEADETMREAFENEIKFMARLNHESVVRLLGVSLDQHPFIMMEYMEKGDLNNYLKAQEYAAVNSHPLPDGTVDVAVLVYICLQVASGMKYLASLKFIHRDLATRNILVGQEFKVKIADFGMSQRLYSSYYYRIKGTAVLPIRWMASECFYGRFSEKTDVWAFGVAMWEIFTLCRQQPYESFTDQALIDDAIKGEGRTLLSRPETCPEEVYHVMLRCWVNMPEDRANFEEIHGLLSQIHAYSDI